MAATQAISFDDIIKSSQCTSILQARAPRLT